MPFRWKVKGRKLLIISDRWATEELIPFEFTDANTLVVTMKLFSSHQVSLTRADSGSRKVLDGPHGDTTAEDPPDDLVSASLRVVHSRRRLELVH